MSTPRRSSKSVLIRDLMILLMKLVLDGLKDALLIQLAIAAVVFDLLFGRADRPLLFYRVLRLGERFDLWLNLYGAADGAEESGDGLFGASRAGSNTLLGRLEQIVRQRVEEIRTAAGTG
jgi:hypothetical protein